MYAHNTEQTKTCVVLLQQHDSTLIIFPLKYISSHGNNIIQIGIDQAKLLSSGDETENKPLFLHSASSHKK